MRATRRKTSNPSELTALALALADELGDVLDRSPEQVADRLPFGVRRTLARVIADRRARLDA